MLTPSQKQAQTEADDARKLREQILALTPDQFLTLLYLERAEVIHQLPLFLPRRRRVARTQAGSGPLSPEVPSTRLSPKNRGDGIPPKHLTGFLR